MVTETAVLIAEARRYGRLELVDGKVVVEGEFPKTLIEELRTRKEDLREVLRNMRGRSPLTSYATDDLGLRVVARGRYPMMALTLRETEDSEGDVRFIRRVHAILQEIPGGDRIIVAIHSNYGPVERLQWRAKTTPKLRRTIAHLLLERAQALGLIVNRQDFVCRICGGDALAYEPRGLLFCPSCRLRGWRNDYAEGHD